MKIKNIQLSLAVLLMLVVLSFSFYVNAQQNSNISGNIFLDSDQDGLTDQEEVLYGTDAKKADTDGDGYSDGTEVKSGYDPKKPAPGDKLATASFGDSNLENSSKPDENNLTNKVSQKITEIVQTAQESEEGSEVTLDQLQEIIDQSLTSSEMSEESLPEIKREDIKILKQNYSQLSDEEKQKKMKDDFLNYAVAIAYIFSSNSPEPITSSQDINKIVTAVYKNITQAIEARSVSELDDLEKSGDKILEQLKEVSVPEEMVDTHIKAMQYAMYAKELGKTLTPNPDDPLKEIANFSKMQTYVESLQDFTSDIQEKFTEYEITYDDDLRDRLKNVGLDKIDLDEEETEEN